MDESNKEKWAKILAGHRHLAAPEHTHCGNCGELLDPTNEYGHNFGTCNSGCYGELIGVYTDAQYAGAEE